MSNLNFRAKNIIVGVFFHIKKKNKYLADFYTINESHPVL